MLIIAEIVLQWRLLKASKGKSINGCKLSLNCKCHAQARTDTKRCSAKTGEW